MDLTHKIRQLAERLKGDFNESDHPRADDGKFGSGSGGGESTSKKPAGKPIAPAADTVHQFIASDNEAGRAVEDARQRMLKARTREEHAAARQDRERAVEAQHAQAQEFYTRLDSPEVKPDSMTHQGGDYKFAGGGYWLNNNDGQILPVSETTVREEVFHGVITGHDSDADVKNHLAIREEVTAEITSDWPDDPAKQKEELKRYGGARSVFHDLTTPEERIFTRASEYGRRGHGDAEHVADQPIAKKINERWSLVYDPRSEKYAPKETAQLRAAADKVVARYGKIDAKEAPPLAAKLHRLRTRFLRLLKGDFNEQDHPRADDGKFGSGGAGGGGGDKPAGKAPTPTFASSDNANKWGTKNVVTEGGVSKDETKALRRYQSAQGYYNFMNLSLRDPTYTTTPENQAAIAHMDAVMARSEVKEPIIAMRGMNFRGASEKFKVGQTYTDKGFVSTTIDTTTAHQFAGARPNGEQAGSRVVCEIHIPAGAKAVYLKGKGESELLLDRGASFRVDEVKAGNPTRVKMTLIPRQPEKTEPRTPALMGSTSTKQQQGDEATDPRRFSWGADELELELEPATNEPASDETTQKLLVLRTRFLRLLRGEDA